MSNSVRNSENMGHHSVLLKSQLFQERDPQTVSFFSFLFSYVGITFHNSQALTAIGFCFFFFFFFFFFKSCPCACCIIKTFGFFCGAHLMTNESTIVLCELWMIWTQSFHVIDTSGTWEGKRTNVWLSFIVLGIIWTFKLWKWRRKSSLLWLIPKQKSRFNVDNLDPNTRNETKLTGLCSLLMGLDLNGSDAISAIK